MSDHKQGADASAAAQKFGPPVPQSALACIQEYGDARADGNEMSGTLLCRTIIELRRWAASVAALAAAAPADAGESRVPAGFKLVPAEPTDAMLEAVAPFPVFLRAEHPDPNDPWHRDMAAATRADQAAAASTYREMLEAAPEAPTAPLPAAEEVGRNAARYLWLRDRLTGDNWESVHDETGSHLLEGERLDSAIDAAITTLPPGEPKP